MNVLRAARFLLSLGMRIDRARLARAVVLMLGGYVATPLAALALGRFADDALAHRVGPTLWLAVVTAALLVAQLMMSHFAHLDYFELAETQESRLRTELIELVNGPPGVEHLDSPAFADELGLVRESLFGGPRALEAVLQLTGLVLQTVITGAILIALSPWLALLPLAAVPPVVFARKAQEVFERAREQTAEQIRLNAHLIELATRIESVKELRIVGADRELLRRQETAWRVITERMWRGQAAGAALRSVGQLIFAVGYGGAIFLVIRSAAAGHATIGDLVLVITLAVQVSVQIAGALQLLAVLQSAGKTVERIDSLRAMAAPRAGRRPGRVRPPEAFAHGIAFEHVSFCYPGSDTPVLDDVCLTLPAGRTLALVGENGAGKSTLVKLLCGMYTPTSGRILVDGVDLADLDPAEWRARVATLFQDFYRFEFTLREGIGLGEVARLGDDAALARAIDLARAQRVVEAVPGGLAGFTGRGYGDGAELSGGQWQTVGLARCLMRDRPRLLVLDEPAAALDAAAEHALFDRYASSASAAARDLGGITVLISHRFSTVRMADMITVLAGGRLLENGTHDALMAHGGQYAELFRLQARAYR
ncbi:ABC transporter ATP-binding protein [Actinoallomurus vinaceus]|uniref:ABC transporter ATP-binding protein n=1 Tax=Actinoallomurus vinaceus TaxID=1080074 RepID=A0ABP8UWJ8_9ACTN